MSRRRHTGSETYTHALGVEPRFLVLTFTPPTTPGLEYLQIFKRMIVGDPTSDVLFVEERVVDRIAGFYPYYFIMITSEEGATYVVDYLDTNGAPALTPATRIATEQYPPPLPISQEVYINGGMYVKEHVFRDYHILETMGEKAILLRRRNEGQPCECVVDQTRNPDSECLDCYGTGYDGGYTVFYPFLVNFQLGGERIQLTETALVLDQQPRAWTTIAPDLRDGDVVIRLHKQLYDRFEVMNPTRSVRDGVAAVPTIQEFTLKVHQRGHPIYNYPVENTVSTYVAPTTHAGMPEEGV